MAYWSLSLAVLLATLSICQCQIESETKSAEENPANDKVDTDTTQEDDAETKTNNEAKSDTKDPNKIIQSFISKVTEQLKSTLEPLQNMSPKQLDDAHNMLATLMDLQKVSIKAMQRQIPKLLNPPKFQIPFLN